MGNLFDWRVCPAKRGSGHVIAHCPDRWEVGPYFAHHRNSCAPLHPYVTLHFEMLVFHTFQSADEVERKGNSSAALQVPFLTTWVVIEFYIQPLIGHLKKSCHNCSACLIELANRLWVLKSRQFWTWLPKKL